MLRLSIAVASIVFLSKLSVGTCDCKCILPNIAGSSRGELVLPRHFQLHRPSLTLIEYQRVADLQRQKRIHREHRFSRFNAHTDRSLAELSHQAAVANDFLSRNAFLIEDMTDGLQNDNR